MSGDIITNDTKTINFTIQLSTNCDIFGNNFFINKANVVDLQLAKEKMILGLDFIVHDNRSIIITKDYLLISANSQMSSIIDELTSGLRTKHGDAPTNTSNQCPCDIPGSCKIKGSQNYGRISTLETPHDSYQENILDSIKIETELQYELSVAESEYNSIKINQIITFDNILLDQVASE